MHNKVPSPCRTVDNILLSGKQYHEVIYDCDPGFLLSDTGLGHMFCQQGGWMGVHPYCEEDPHATDGKGGGGLEGRGDGSGGGEDYEDDDCGEYHE